MPKPLMHVVPSNTLRIGISPEKLAVTIQQRACVITSLVKVAISLGGLVPCINCWLDPTSAQPANFVPVRVDTTRSTVQAHTLMCNPSG